MARVPLVMIKPTKPISEMTEKERKAFVKDVARLMRKSLHAAQAAERSLPPEV